MRSAFAEIRCFLAQVSFASINASVLGWRFKRDMTGGVISMVFDKALDGFTPYDLAVRTWGLVQGRLELSELFSKSLGASMRCLQEVNDTNVVLLLNLANGGDGTALRVLFLATFVKVDWGFAVLFQSVDRALFEVRSSVECEDQWINVQMWCVERSACVFLTLQC